MSLIFIAGLYLRSVKSWVCIGCCFLKRSIFIELAWTLCLFIWVVSITLDWAACSILKCQSILSLFISKVLLLIWIYWIIYRFISRRVIKCSVLIELSLICIISHNNFRKQSIVSIILLWFYDPISYFYLL